MNQEIALEVITLHDVVKKRLDSERPEGIQVGLPLFSNKLSPKDLEQIRADLHAKLKAEAVVDGFEPLVALARPQDENEAGSLIVTFQKI
ncbi:hypothetical protein [Pseudomonas sp. NC02]|uniref:hypothetical protein n=1 Tax=Pseudomonas sp. NC02 TaxID=2067572 RepID=UPI000C856F65|nr:hypothetical protein [Pseudomonas sp. NC02]AUO23225.1 hypothetical protein C0058_15035 [Pseudomonas sp. NC02]